MLDRDVVRLDAAAPPAAVALRVVHDLVRSPVIWAVDLDHQGAPVIQDHEVVPA